MDDHMVNVIPQLNLDMRSKLESDQCWIYEADIDFLKEINIKCSDKQECFHSIKKLEEEQLQKAFIIL